MPSKRSDNNRLLIPEECRRVKADYATRPTDALVREIKQFIAATGKPHLWRGHTHTKPLVGSKPVYLDEFDLPLANLKAGHLAPCPCCWSNHPKYGLSGKIAWFPDEAVIRLLGPDCFAAMDKNAHAEALALMRQEKRRKQDIAYLLSNTDALQKLPAVFERAVAIGGAVDQFKADLRHTFIERLNIPIWENVRTGKLQVWEEFRDLDRRGEVQTLTRKRDYASINGIAMLSPEVKTFAFRASQFLDGREFLERDGWQGRIDALDDRQRHEIAVLINRRVTRGRRLLAEIKVAGEFVSDLNLATLRTWAARRDCPHPFLLQRNENTLLIGTKPNAMFRVQIPMQMEDEMPEIEVPTIKEMPEEEEELRAA